MYKVLIVDDEPIHRRGLTNMIKALRPDYCISNAKNGIEALEYIKLNPVDLLITDIQMPLMDGLELIEHLKDITKEIKIIILSVYGYFDYAQKAIALGAFDYILKPVDEEKVDEVLKKVEKKISQELAEKHEKEGLKRQLDNVLPVCLEYKMNKLIYGLLNTNEYEEISRNFPYGKNGVVIISQLYRHDTSNEFNISKEIMSDIKYKVNFVLNTFGSASSFILQDETNSIVSILDTPPNVYLCYTDNIKKFNKLISEIKETHGLGLTIGVGSKYEDFFNEVKCSFKHAKKALKYNFYTGPCEVIFYDGVNIKLDYQSINREMKETLADAILKLDKEWTNQLIDNFFSIMLKDGYPKVEHFLNNTANFLENQIKIIDKRLSSDYSEQLKTDINDNLFDCTSFKELKALTCQMLFKLIDILALQKNNRNSAVIEMCKKYIEEHYMEDISLDSVARVFYFNSSYFSNFFKCHTDTNFCEYLFRIRMNNAKRFLQDTSYKVYEISKMVGYQDPKYFNRQFKKECGLTPDEYRRMFVRKELK